MTPSLDRRLDAVQVAHLRRTLAVQAADLLPFCLAMRWRAGQRDVCAILTALQGLDDAGMLRHGERLRRLLGLVARCAPVRGSA